MTVEDLRGAGDVSVDAGVAGCAGGGEGPRGMSRTASRHGPAQPLRGGETWGWGDTAHLTRMAGLRLKG